MSSARKFLQSMLAVIISISLCFPTSISYATEGDAQGESYATDSLETMDLDSIDMDEFAPVMLNDEGQIINPQVEDAVEEEVMKDPLDTDEFGAVLKVLTTNSSYWTLEDDPTTPEYEINLHADTSDLKYLNTALRYTNGKNTQAYGMSAVRVLFPLDNKFQLSGSISSIGGDYWNASINNPTTLLTLTNKRAWSEGEVINGYAPIQFAMNPNNMRDGEDYLFTPYYTIAGKTTNMQTIKIHYTEDKSLYKTEVTSGRLDNSLSLGDNYKDYIWVKYNLTWDYNNGEKANSASSKYYEIFVPEGVVNQKGEDVSGTLRVNATERSQESTIVVLGYPMNDYNNKTVEFNYKLCGNYKYETQATDLAEASIAGGIYLNSDDYDFTYTGDLIGLSLKSDDEEIYAVRGKELSYPLSYKAQLISNLSRDNYLADGKKADISIYFDFADYMDESGSYQDTDNLPTRLSIPANPFNNYEGKVITYPINYEVVGIKDNQETVIGSFDTSESQSIDVSGESYERVKLTFKDISEPVTTTKISYRKNVQLVANSYRIGTGYIRSLAALDVIVKDTSGNTQHITADDAISGSTYTGPGAERVKQRDKDTYGHYMYRSFGQTAVLEWVEVEYRNYLKSYANEGYFHEYRQGTVYENSTFGFQQHKEGNGAYAGIKKFILTATIPTFAAPRYEDIFRVNNIDYTTASGKELTLDYLKSHCNLAIENIGRNTKYTFYFDFSDDLIYPGKQGIFRLNIPTATPIYDHIQFGPTYSVNTAVDIKSNEWDDSWHQSSSDSASSSRDINIDGASEQSIFNKVTSGVMNKVYAQSGYTYKGEDYTWRPIVTTGGASLRNITFFTVLNENDHEGSRLKNIDYSFMTKQGFNPTVKVIYNSLDESTKSELMEQRDFNDPRWETYDASRASEVYAIALRCNGILDSANATSFMINIDNNESNDNNDNHIHTNSYYVQYEEANDMTSIVTKKELESAQAMIILTDLQNSVKNLKVYKKFGDNILTGAVFSLYDGDNLIASNLTADPDNGYINLRYLPRDKQFYLKETKAPTGYILDETPIDLSAKIAEAAEQADESGNIDTIAVDVKNEKANGNIVFYKVDALTGKPIEGATFEAASGSFRKAGVSDSTGKVVIADVPQGTYSISETKSAPGYVYFSGSIPLKFWRNGVNLASGRCSVKVDSSVMDSNGNVYLLFSDGAYGSYYDGPYNNTPYVPNWHKDFKLNIELVDQFGNPCYKEVGFELTDPNGKVVKSSVSGTSGDAILKTDSQGKKTVSFSAALLETGFITGDYKLKLVDDSVDSDFTEQLINFDWDETKYTGEGDKIDYNELSRTIKVPINVPTKKTTLTKVDQSNNPVEGATFDITYARATKDQWGTSYTPVGSTIKVTTNAEGKAEFELAEGAYIFEETNIPKGYDLTDSNFSVAPYPGVISSAGAEWNAFTLNSEYMNNVDENGITIKVTNNQIRPSITIKKYEELADGTKTTNPIAGATFRLVSDDDTSKTTLPMMTSALGVVTFNKVEWGSWHVEETAPAFGYYSTDEKPSFEINADNASESQTITMYNKSNRDQLSIKTVDAETREPLGGVTLNMVSKDYTVDNEMSNFITGEDATSTFQNIPAASFEIERVAVPDGYVLDGDNISFNYGGVNDPVKVIEVPIKRATGSLYIHKYDSLNDEAVPNAKFTLEKESIIDGESQWDAISSNLTTDESGDITVNDLEWGNYRLVENENEGYDLTNFENIQITIDSTNARGSESPIAVNSAGSDKGVSNDPITHTLTIHKYAKEDGVETEIPVEGAEFDIIQNGKTIDSVTTDVNGVATFDKLSYGDYTVNEKIAPEGYVAAEDQSFSISRDALQDKELTFYDERKPINIKIQKKDSKTNEILSGAKFELKNSSGELVKEEFEVGSEGYVINDLPWGDYYLVEKESPRGYYLNEGEMKIEAYDTYAKDEPTIIDFFNDPITSGPITVKTVDAETNEPLSNVEFEVYNESTDELSYEKFSTNGEEASHKIEALDFGDYYLKEISVPQGYKLADPVDVEHFKHSLDSNEIIIPVERLKGTVNVIKYANDNKLNHTSDVLKSAKFELYKVNGEVEQTKVDEGITNDEGKLQFVNLDWGNYLLKETQAPADYQLAEDIEFSIDALNAENCELTIYDNPSKSPITVKTIDAVTKEPLADVKVELFNSEDNSFGEKDTIGSDASTSYDKMEFGSYYCNVNSVPQGYLLKDYKTTFENTITGHEVVIPIERNVSAVTLTKVDSTDLKPIPGAVFSIYGNYKEFKGYEVLGEEYSHTDNLVDGQITYNNKGYGNNQNWVKVVTIPGAEELNVTLTYQTENINYDYVCVWEGNHPTYKPSSNYSSAKAIDGQQKLGNSTIQTKSFTISGDSVTFGFKSDSSVDSYLGYQAVVTAYDKTKPIYEEKYGEIERKVTDDNGDIIFDNNGIGLDWGNYEVKEVSNAGYMPNKDYNLVINENNAKGKEDPIRIGGVSSLITNDRIPGNIKINKFIEDFNGNIPNYFKKTTTSGNGGYSETPEKFHRITSSYQYGYVTFEANLNCDAVLDFDWLVSAHPQAYGCFSLYKNNTLVSGTGDTVTKLYGDNTLVSTSDFEGHWRNQSYELTPGNYKIVFTFYKPYSNYTGGMNSLFIKEFNIHRSNDTSVKGAKFVLYQGESILPYRTVEANDAGVIEFNDIPWGDYKLKEIEAPIGYKVTEEVKEITIDRDNTSYFYNIVDKPEKSKFEIHKYDTSSKEPLEGVHFLLTDTDGNEIQELVTDSNGIAISNELEWGTYYLTETATAKGHILNESPREITLDRFNTNEPKVIEIPNNRILGNVKLVKMSDLDKTTKLEGAVYNLYSSSGELIKEGLTTDENGEINVTGLDWNNYYFLETQAPEGYSISTERIRFSININNCTSQQTVVAYDRQDNISATVSKTIDAADVNFENGNPSFIFILKNQNGNYERRANITFTKASPNIGGKYTASVVFDDLIIGDTYTVSEASSIRYEIGDYKINGEKTNQFTVNSASDKINIEFLNNKNLNKNGHSNYSESGSVINLIKSKQSITGLTAEWNSNPIYQRPINWDEFIHVFVSYDDGETRDINYSDGTNTGWKIISLTNKENQSESYLEDEIPSELSGIYTLEIEYEYSGIQYNTNVDIMFTKPETFAIYSADDNSLTFYNNIDKADVKENILGTSKKYNGKTVTNLYENFTENNSTPPWYSVRTSVKSVSIADGETIAPKYTTSWFNGFSNSSFTSIDLTNMDMSNVESMASMFYGASYLTNIKGLSSSNKLTNMQQTFCNTSRITNLDLSNLDTSNVYNFNSTFSGMTSLTLVSFGDNFLLNSSLDNSSMFMNCSKLSSIDLDFNIPNSEHIERMFYGCSSLTNVNNIINDKSISHSYLFYNCRSLTSIDLSGFDTSASEDMSYMFQQCAKLNNIDITNFNTSKVKNMSYMFSGCSAITNLNLTTLNTLNLVSANYMFAAMTSLNTIDITPIVENAIDNNISMNYMFSGDTKLKAIYAPNNTDLRSLGDTKLNSMFYNCTVLEGTMGTKYDSNNTSSTRALIDGYEMQEGYFSYLGPYDLVNTAIYSADDNSLTLYNNVTDRATIGQDYNGKVVTKIYKYFNNKDIMPWSSIKTLIKSVKVQDSGISIKTVNNAFNSMTNCISIDIAKLDLTNNSDLSSMFSGNSSLANVTLNNAGTLSNNFDTVETTKSMFNGCQKLITVEGIENITFDSLEDTSFMFNNCSSIVNIDLSSIQGNLNNIQSMFEGCKKLKTLNINNLSVKKVKDFSRLFYNCNALTDIDITNWDTSSAEDMSYMFYYCNSIKNISHNFSTHYVKNMGHMFERCGSLQTIDLTFDTSNLNSTVNMFYYCSNLKEIDISSWSVKTPIISADELRGMFNYCTSLQHIYTNPDLNWSTLSYNTFYTLPLMFDNDRSLVYWNGYNSYQYALVHQENKDEYGNIISSNYGLFEGKTTYYPLPLIMKAVIYEEEPNNLYFYNRTDKSNKSLEYDGKTIKEIFDVPYNTKITSYSAIPWSSYSNNIENIYFEDPMNPIYSSYWFNRMTKLKKVYNGENFLTNKLAEANYMFYGCGALETIYSTNDWYTSKSNVKATSMFYNCNNLTGGLGTKADSLTDVMSQNPFKGAVIDGVNDHNGLLTCNTIPMSKVAVYSANDNSLIFYNNTDTIDLLTTKEYNGREITQIYMGLEQSKPYLNNTQLVNGVVYVDIADQMNFNNLSEMFCGFVNLTKVDNLDNLLVNGDSSSEKMFKDCTSLSVIYYCEPNNSTLDKILSENSNDMFGNCVKLRGQNGTAYSKTESEARFKYSWDGYENETTYSKNFQYPYFTTDTGESITYSQYGSNATINLQYKKINGENIYKIPNYISEQNNGIYKLSGYIYGAIDDSDGSNYYTSYTVITTHKGSDDASRAIIDGFNGRPGYFSDKRGLELINAAIFFEEDNSLILCNHPGEFVKVGDTYDGKTISAVTNNLNNRDGDVFDSYYNNTEAILVENEITIKHLDELFKDMSNLITIEGLSNIKSDSTDYSGMFQNCSSVKTLNLNEFKVDITDQTKTNDMFNGCVNLTTIYADPQDKWYEVTIDNSQNMFYGCESLVGQNGTTYALNNSYRLWHNGDIGTISYGNISTYIDYYYNGSTLFYTQNWTSDNTVSQYSNSAGIGRIKASWLTSGNAYIYDRDLFDSLVQPDGYIYYKLSGNEIDPCLNNIADSSMAYIDGEDEHEGYFSFKGPYTLNNIAIYSKDDNSINIYNNNDQVIIGEKYNGKTVDKILTNLHTLNSLSEVETVNINDLMAVDSGENLFKDLKKLTSINGLDKLTIEDNNYNSMFENCSSLVNLDISGLGDAQENMSLATSKNMFSNCTALATIYAKETDYFNNITSSNSTGMFSGCEKLTGGEGTKLNIKNYKTIWLTGNATQSGSYSPWGKYVDRATGESFEVQYKTFYSKMISGEEVVKFNLPSHAKADESGNIYFKIGEYSSSIDGYYIDFIVNNSDVTATNAQIDGLNGNPGLFSERTL